LIEELSSLVSRLPLIAKSGGDISQNFTLQNKSDHLYDHNTYNCSVRQLQWLTDPVSSLVSMVQLKGPGYEQQRLDSGSSLQLECHVHGQELTLSLSSRPHHFYYLQFSMHMGGDPGKESNW